MAYFTMKKLSYALLPSLAAVLCFSISTLPLHAQLKVGNRPASQHKSAVLELESGSQGLLLTRVADTSVMTGLNPPDGMIIYFTDGRVSEPFGPNAGTYQRKGGKWINTWFIINTTILDDQGIKFTLDTNVFTLHLPDANRSLRGVVNSGRQQFGGRKTFVDSIVLQNTHPGSIIFVRDAPSSVNWALTENNVKFFWDNVNERLGIGTNTPSASLDVKGNFKLGENGSVLNSIIRDSVLTSSAIPLNTGDGYLYSFPFTNLKAGANVTVSLQNGLPDGCIIAYAYSTLGNIHIRIENIKAATIPANFKFYIAVIQ